MVITAAETRKNPSYAAARRALSRAHDRGRNLKFEQLRELT